MFYRMRIYSGVARNVSLFNDFFANWLLPVQLRHGARLVGRWQTDDDRIVAIWQYDSREAYEKIDAAIRSDPDAIAAQKYRRSLPKLFETAEQTFMHSTLSA